MNCRQAHIVALTCLIITLISASAVFGQSTARVIQDHTLIWRDVSTVAASVPAGTVLEVVDKVGKFYLVIIPAEFGGHGEVGRIAASSITFVPGSAGTPVRPGSVDRVDPATPAREQKGPSSPETASRRREEPGIAVRGFGQAGLVMPSARESFRAVADNAHGFAFGGGVQLRLRNGVFFEGSFDQFRKEGERVFVDDDATVFRLGIPNTITVRSLLFSGGYRFRSSGRMIPFVAGGVGISELTERTPFSDDNEAVDEQHVGYRISGGVEVLTGRVVGMALEGAYTRVPDSLGVGGMSQVTGERDLGGFAFRMKLLFGR